MSTTSCPAALSEEGDAIQVRNVFSPPEPFLRSHDIIITMNEGKSHGTQGAELKDSHNSRNGAVEASHGRTGERISCAFGARKRATKRVAGRGIMDSVGTP